MVFPTQQQQPASRPLSEKSNSHNYILYLTLAIVGLLLIIWLYLLVSNKPTTSKRISKQIKESQPSDDEGSEYEYVEVTDDEAEDEDVPSQLPASSGKIAKTIGDEVNDLEAENAELQSKA